MKVKSDLRKLYRKIRKSLPNKHSLDQEIIIRFRSLLSDIKYTHIALYKPIDGEVDVTKLILPLQTEGKIICFPETLPNRLLKFVQLNEVNNSHNHSYQEIQNAILKPEVITVPLIAFNGECHRLGFGGGYFDVEISNARKNQNKTIYIGVAYEEQFCPDLKIEQHDQKLDYVITQNKIYRNE